MSGGSYDYLCHSWDLEDIVGKRHNLDRMAERLARLGYAADAAAETLNLIADLNAMAVRAEVALKRLTPVWRAVEWWDSGDYSEDAIHSALGEYRNPMPVDSAARDSGLGSDDPRLSGSNAEVNDA